jgi:acyl carrier protein phosphodiesterase
LNHLAHTFLSWQVPEILTANVFCDMFTPAEVKALDKSLLKGITMHRWIDQYTDSHTIVKQSHRLLQPHFEKYAPVALDIYFDHFLALKWSYFSDEPFDNFCHNSYTMINSKMHLLPNRLHSRVEHMIDACWLHSFATAEQTQITFEYLKQRARFENNFHRASEILEAHFFELEGAFMEFFPELSGYSRLRLEELNDD